VTEGQNSKGGSVLQISDLKKLKLHQNPDNTAAHQWSDSNGHVMDTVQPIKEMCK